MPTAHVDGDRVSDAVPEFGGLEAHRFEIALQRLARVVATVAGTSGAFVQYRSPRGDSTSIVWGNINATASVLANLAEAAFARHFDAVPQAGDDSQPYVLLRIWLHADCVAIICLDHSRRAEFDQSLMDELANVGRIGEELIESFQRSCHSRDQEQRAFDFVRASGDWLWETDEEDVCRWVSENFESATGFSNTRIVGRPIPDRLMLDWLGRPLEPRRTFSEEMKKHVEVRAVFLMGGNSDNARFVSMSAVPRFKNNGSFAGYRGISRDVTDRVRLETAARDRDAAQRDSKAKTAFLSRVSHELRTPLNAIIGFSHLSLERLHTGAPADLTDWIRSIAGAGDRLLAVVSQLMDITRIEQDQVDIDIEPVEIEECIDESIRLARADAKYQDVALSVDATVRDTFVLADKGSVAQIITNLLSNAFKYNRAGGKIDIRVTGNPADAGYVDVTITDGGIGIDPEAMSQLFQPFSRLGAERSDIPGNGLGLSISRALARKMDGDITISSTKDVGTSCTLTLPRASHAPAPPVELEDSNFGAIEGLPPKTLTILCIEDDPINQILIAEVIRSVPGIVLTIARTGEEGIIKAMTEVPDVVILDMHLPDMHGNDVLAKLRSEPATRTVRCIVLSADALPQQVNAAIEHGASDYWTKPIDLKQLRRRLKFLRETSGSHRLP